MGENFPGENFPRTLLNIYYWEKLTFSKLVGKQKQSPEVFYKKRYSYKFHKIHRKTPVPESLFKQSCRSQACYFIKKEILAQVFSCFTKFLRIPFLQNTSGRLLLGKVNLSERKFEEMHEIWRAKRCKYIWENVYFGIIIFNCLSSTKQCLRFLLNCFVQEIKDFY